MTWAAILTAIRRFPYVKQIATVALAVLLGFVAGNYHATQAALKIAIDAEQDAAARRQAAVNGALFEHEKETVARIHAAVAQQRLNDEAVHELFKASLSTVSKRRADAEKALAQLETKSRDLQMQNSGLLGVNKNMADAMQRGDMPCVFPAALRRVLDQSSGAGSNPGDSAERGNTETNSAGRADGDAAARAVAPLRCEQLVHGYVLLGEWGQNIAAQLEALQAWERSAR